MVYCCRRGKNRGTILSLGVSATNYSIFMVDEKNHNRPLTPTEVLTSS